jgi:hypothetical protein
MALKNTLAAAVLFFVLANSVCLDKAGAGEPASQPVVVHFLNERYSDESYGFVGDLSELIPARRGQPAYGEAEVLFHGQRCMVEIRGDGISLSCFPAIRIPPGEKGVMTLAGEA